MTDGTTRRTGRPGSSPADASRPVGTDGTRLFGLGASPREQYLELQRTRPWLFRNHAGGVRVATDPAEMDRISGELAEHYEAQGWPGAWAEVGVGYRDPYVMMLREAVVFPDGSPGIHHRLSTYSDEPSGIAVLPLLEGKIVMVRHYRHPVRAWCWEIPRGARDPGESVETAGRRELAEEIEAEVGSFVSLGRMCGSTGVVSMIVELAVAELRSVGSPRRSEGIEQISTFSPAEVEALIEADEVLDAFSVGCFFRARLRKLL